MLLMALTGIILLSKKFAVVLEIGLNRLGAPQAVAGIVIAMVVLAPESITALRAAQRNMLQKSLNLALGSSLATIGLTIPAVAVTNVVLNTKRSDFCIRPHQCSCRAYSSACIRHVPIFGFHSLNDY
jgi:Ca2+:H+ antiporter